ncbi:glutaminyl-peptide cyclotransferase [Luteirhabdus pelagi]|uniref:glutaminyl-peptide cyclotransferase n=1 Tax=Luteirhabdus pelagi TaxID=2792783 RepID=UPI001939E690|nr:glutaminyl-peptide cyclotransferase [Luteirhabdus pelagi]
MRPAILFSITLLTLLLHSCGDERLPEDTFQLRIANAQTTYKPSNTLKVSIDSKQQATIDSIQYSFDGTSISANTANTEVEIPLAQEKLGKRKLTATIFSEGESYEAQTEITLLSPVKPTLYLYEILETYPHDPQAYTQGLEFENDTLYESTGRRKYSSLRKTDYKTGEVISKIDLDDQYFGEGLTIMNNTLYQLTWQSGKGFVYSLQPFEQIDSFVYNKSKEGWGLCNDGKLLYKSDGTERIWTLDPKTLEEQSYIEIYTNTSRIPRVNELEWVEGKIYANVYQQGSIAIVNPASGAVEGVIDLTDLIDNVTATPDRDVLNGIAYKGEKDILYITGKNWDKLFKVRIYPK